MDQEIDTAVVDETAADAAPSEPATALDAINQELGYAEKPAEPPAEKPEAKPAEQQGQQPKPAAKADPKKTPDYTPPAGLSPDSMRRFQSLVADNKATRAELETLKGQAQQFEAVQKDVQAWNGIFEDAKCQPQQFELAIDFIKCVNTGNFDRAAQIITDQMRQLTLATGRDFTAADPLQGHADLQKAVQEQQITRQHALELARSRQNEAAQRRTAEQGQRQQEQQAQWNNAVQAGGKAVDDWLKEKQANDIDWPAKEAKLNEEIDWLATEVHPSKWVAHLEKFYGLIQVGSPPPAARTTQPLRANGGAGGAQAAPTSMLEAINRGLQYDKA